jgi:hypothetical protein
MDIGKRYKMHWVAMGCPRTAYFDAESVAKNGTIKGRYTDADGKPSRFYVKPAQFAEWLPA